LEDASAVDSGSDDEGVRGLLPNGWGGVLGSTDWGWQQLDEESQVRVLEHMTKTSIAMTTHTLQGLGENSLSGEQSVCAGS
jgi:hypothetical protein